MCNYPTDNYIALVSCFMNQSFYHTFERMNFEFWVLKKCLCVKYMCLWDLSHQFQWTKGNYKNLLYNPNPRMVAAVIADPHKQGLPNVVSVIKSICNNCDKKLGFYWIVLIWPLQRLLSKIISINEPNPLYCVFLLMLSNGCNLCERNHI